MYINSGELSLRELRCTTSSLESVLLSFLHTRVTSEKSCLLKSRTKFCIILEKCTGEAVTDSACLTGNTAACYTANDIELAESVGECEGLTYDEL